MTEPSRPEPGEFHARTPAYPARQSDVKPAPAADVSITYNHDDDANDTGGLVLKRAPGRVLPDGRPCRRPVRQWAARTGRR